MKNKNFIFFFSLCAMHLCNIFAAKKFVPNVRHKTGSQEIETMINKKTEKQKQNLKESAIDIEFDPEFILKALTDEGFIPKNSVRSKVIRKVYRDIIFFNNQNLEGVIKITDGGEHKALIQELNLVQFANDLKKTYQNTPLPIIIEPEGGLMIGGQYALVFNKAKGIPLSQILNEKLKTMSDQNIDETFSDIGKQIGNLDRLFFEKKGGILCHVDSHSDNFFYDEKNKQLYWIDTKGVHIKSKIESSLRETKVCLRWLKEARKDWTNDTRSRLISIFNLLYQEIKKTNSKECLKIFKQNSIDTKALDLLKFSPLEKQQQKIKNLLNKLAQQVQKYLLVLKSFGKGYIIGNPQTEEIFNNFIKKNKHWNALVEQIIEISKILNLDIHFVNPIQKQ